MSNKLQTSSKPNLLISSSVANTKRRSLRLASQWYSSEAGHEQSSESSSEAIMFTCAKSPRYGAGEVGEVGEAMKAVSGKKTVLSCFSIQWILVHIVFFGWLFLKKEPREKKMFFFGAGLPSYPAYPICQPKQACVKTGW